jgi:hypothetical protein
MKKTILVISLLLVFLASCNGPLPEEPLLEETPVLDSTTIHQTAAARVTEDLALTQTAQPPAPTPLPSGTWTPQVTLDRTRPVVGSPTADIHCNRAAAGHPIDITVPDGTIFAPGETFSKTWRLKNVGTCTWTRLYAVVFFSGNSLGALQTNTLPAEVPPGSVVDVTVEFQAPMESGVYQSNWMLSDAEGEFFGLGPNGDAPFWVRIAVVPSVTDTPQPSATPTSTPVVYISGEAALVDQDRLDLDTGDLNAEEMEGPDLVYLYGGDPVHVLMTLNGMTWMVFGEEEPAFHQCDLAEMGSSAVSFDADPMGIYLCYRTSSGLPGRMYISGFDAEGEQLQISFLTWAVP